MARKFTAEEFREMAAEAEVIEVADQFDGHNMDTIAAMLRQAADAMEREKKYEYTVKYEDGVISRLHYDCVEPLENGRNENHRIVRREVGEWEEVK